MSTQIFPFMCRVAIINFEMGVVKSSMQKFNCKTLHDNFFCLQIVLDCNSFIYKQNHLIDRCLRKNTEIKLTCNWACIIVFQQL